MNLEDRVAALEATVERQNELIINLFDHIANTTDAATTALTEGRFTSQALGILGMALTFSTCPLDQEFLIGQFEGLKIDFDTESLQIATVAVQNIGSYWTAR